MSNTMDNRLPLKPFPKYSLPTLLKNGVFRLATTEGNFSVHFQGS